MAKNFVQKGDVVTVTSPSGGVSSGDPVMIGTLFGVATHDAAEDADLELAVEGVWDIPGDTNLVISAGDRVFWDSTNGWVDKTTASQQCVGVATLDKTQTGATCRVRLGSVTPTET